MDKAVRRQWADPRHVHGGHEQRFDLGKNALGRFQVVACHEECEPEGTPLTDGRIEGNPVSERFESGPGRFNDVEAVDSLQFPEVAPPANEVARAARAADDRAGAAEEAAASARNLAIGGVAVGVVGIVIGAIALGLLATRRQTPPSLAETRRA